MSIKSLYQEIKQWNAKLKVKRKEPIAIPAVDHTYHVCQHCEYGFSGRICPQCGMPAEHVRFTFKRLIHNFLDIWGMGNRPMFRTMRDLIWRPGYMINDYLSGHHLSYFPPFKMLAVLTIFIVLLSIALKLVPFDFSDHLANIIAPFEANGVSRPTRLLLNYITRLVDYLDDNDLSRIMVQNIFVVLAAWITFRKKGYNLVETFFAQIYINCQFHLITIMWILVTFNLPPTYFLPYTVPLGIAVLVLIYDFKQLYGLRLISAIGHTFLFLLCVAVLYIAFLALLFTITLGVESFSDGNNAIKMIKSTKIVVP